MKSERIIAVAVVFMITIVSLTVVSDAQLQEGATAANAAEQQRTGRECSCHHHQFGQAGAEKQRQADTGRRHQQQAEFAPIDHRRHDRRQHQRDQLTMG